MICMTAIVLLLVALLSPICLSIVYDGSLSVTLSYLFWRKPLYPDEKPIRLSNYTPRKLRKRRRRLKQKRSVKRQRAPLKPSKKKGKQPLLRQLRAIRLVLHILKRIYRGLLSSVRIRIDRFHVTVATDDAAKTAILYGAVSQSAAYILELLRNFTKTRVSQEAIRILPNFLAEESTVDLKVRCSIPLFKLAFYGLKSGLIALTHSKSAKQSEQTTKNTDPTDHIKNGGIHHE